MTLTFTESHIQFLDCFFDFQRPRKYPLLNILNGIFYVLDNGLKWRSLPDDFPPFRLAHYYFSRWRDDGTWELLRQTLVALDRESHGRDAEPTACLIDSQSVKNDRFVGEAAGIDGGKRVRGRKRHLVFCVCGTLLGVFVTAANVHDGQAGKEILDKVFRLYPSIEIVFADPAYGGDCRDFIEKEKMRIAEISKRPKEKGFRPLKKRWKAEQGIANLGTCRRLAKDYEHRPDNAETWIRLADILRAFKRLFS